LSFSVPTSFGVKYFADAAPATAAAGKDGQQETGDDPANDFTELV
jgi:hypothetical protein